MNVNIKIARTLDVPVSVERAATLLDNYEATLRRFPKLRRMSRLDEGVYQWEMSPIGSKAAGISHEVRFAARYTVDAKRRELRFAPVPGKGNTTLEGVLKLAPKGEHTQLSFEVRGELRDVPVPLMYRLLAPPFIQGKFTRLVDIFLEENRDALAR